MENAAISKCHTKMDKKALEYDKADASPGPAAYASRTTVGRKNCMTNIPVGPAYTIGQKLNFNAETESPGPVYNLERLTNRGRAVAPKFSLGSKLVELEHNESPGPAAYKPKIPKTVQPKILLPLKELTIDEDRPGPDVYKLPSTLTRKSAPLSKRIDQPIETDSPGPACYAPVPVQKLKKKAPAYSLAKKYEDPVLVDEMKNIAPGPQAYNPSLKYKYNNAPNFSFGIRRPDKFPPHIVCGDNIKKKPK